MNGGNEARGGAGQEQASEQEAAVYGLHCRVDIGRVHGMANVTAREAGRAGCALFVQKDVAVIETHLQSSVSTVCTVSTGTCISGC